MCLHTRSSFFVRAPLSRLIESPTASRFGRVKVPAGHRRRSDGRIENGRGNCGRNGHCGHAARRHCRRDWAGGSAAVSHWPGRCKRTRGRLQWRRPPQRADGRRGGYGGYSRGARIPKVRGQMVWWRSRNGQKCGGRWRRVVSPTRGKSSAYIVKYCSDAHLQSATDEAPPRCTFRLSLSLLHHRHLARPSVHLTSGRHLTSIWCAERDGSPRTALFGQVLGSRLRGPADWLPPPNVSHSASPLPLSFSTDIHPTISRSSCRPLPLRIFIPPPLFFLLARPVLVRCPPFLGTSIRPATHPVAPAGCAVHLQRLRPTSPCAWPWRARRPSSLECCCGAPRASSSSSSLCCELSRSYLSGAAEASVPVDGGGRAKGLVGGGNGWHEKVLALSEMGAPGGGGTPLLGTIGCTPQRLCCWGGFLYDSASAGRRHGVRAAAGCQIVASGCVWLWQRGEANIAGTQGGIAAPLVRQRLCPGVILPLGVIGMRTLEELHLLLWLVPQRWCACGKVARD